MIGDKQIIIINDKPKATKCVWVHLKLNISKIAKFTYLT